MFPTINDNTLLTIDELCEQLFISPTTAYKLLQSGEIKGFKVGSWKIPQKSVREYVKKRCGEQQT